MRALNFEPRFLVDDVMIFAKGDKQEGECQLVQTECVVHVKYSPPLEAFQCTYPCPVLSRAGHRNSL